MSGRRHERLCVLSVDLDSDLNLVVRITPVLVALTRIVEQDVQGGSQFAGLCLSQSDPDVSEVALRLRVVDLHGSNSTMQRPQAGVGAHAGIGEHRLFKESAGGAGCYDFCACGQGVDHSLPVG
jgi:hypothetical protein